MCIHVQHMRARYARTSEDFGSLEIALNHWSIFSAFLTLKEKKRCYVQLLIKGDYSTPPESLPFTRLPPGKETLLQCYKSLLDRPTCNEQNIKWGSKQASVEVAAWIGTSLLPLDLCVWLLGPQVVWPCWSRRGLAGGSVSLWGQGLRFSTLLLRPVWPTVFICCLQMRM